MVLKVDGGKTIVTRASRSNKRFEVRGLYTAHALFLHKHFVSDATVTHDAVVYNDTIQLKMDKTSKQLLLVSDF